MPQHLTTNVPAPRPVALAPMQGGYLHIGPDWRIAAAHLSGGRDIDTQGQRLVGKVLWDIYPDIAGTPFEAAYRATMADRQARTVEASYGPERRILRNHLFPAGDGMALFYEDVGDRRALAVQLERRNRQQEAVARLGVAALEAVDAQDLIERAVREVAGALDVEFAKYVEPRGDGASTLVMRAGVGWRPGVVGMATLSAETGSQAGYALQAHGPVIVTDLAQETRFAPQPLFVEHGIVSGISVLVGPRDRPLGVLGAHSLERRAFNPDDLNFLQAVANLLAAALARQRIEAELRRHRDDLEGLVRERTRLLEASNRELEAFSYSVSHDLRTPLRGIDGYSQLLVQQHGHLLPPSGQALLGKVREAAQRMGHLIESLLALGRVGRRTLSPARVDLSAVADAILDELAAADPGRRVQRAVQPDLVAEGDPDLLRIALANLLGNAWKFSAGRRTARIEVGRDGGDGAFFVRDNGAGFDLAHAGRLFEPFQRLHSSEEFEGTGIGLALVLRIVQRHHGRVWAEAQPGQGATFRFTLGALPE